MKDIPGTEKTVFLQLNKKDLPDPMEYKDLLSMVLKENFTVPPRFSLYGVHQITLPHLNFSRKENASPTVAAVKIISAPSTGRRILAGAQSCLIDAPGTVIANILIIPAAIVAAPCKGLYYLCSGEWRTRPFQANNAPSRSWPPLLHPHAGNVFPARVRIPSGCVAQPSAAVMRGPCPAAPDGTSSPHPRDTPSCGSCRRQ